HPTTPDFVLLRDSEEPESLVEESPEPFIAASDPLYPTEDESSGPDARGRRSEWNRAGAATGAAILGLGLVTLLMGLWGNVDRPSKASRGPSPAGVEQTSSRSRIVTQTAPQQASPIAVESPSLQGGTDGTVLAPVKPGDVGPAPAGDSSSTN